jgi:hypothetical protein
LLRVWHAVKRQWGMIFLVAELPGYFRAFLIQTSLKTGVCNFDSEFYLPACLFYIFGIVALGSYP